MPAGEGQIFRAETRTRCLTIALGADGSMMFSNPLLSRPARTVGPRLWEKMGGGGKKWLNFHMEGEKTPPSMANKEKEERNFPRERLHSVNVRCTGP